MTRDSGRRLSVILVLCVSAFGTLSGTAQARVASDPCRGTDEGRAPNGLICAVMFQMQGGDAVYLGGPEYTPRNADLNALPSNEPLQCPPGTRIPGTDYWSTAFAYNWGWDFFVEDGAWVLSDGQVDGLWPRNAILPGGGEGYNSFEARLDNWHYGSSEFLDVRVFWSCESVGPAKATERPLSLSGDSADDHLQGDEADNALLGRGGDDHLVGGGGADYLHTGHGNDRLAGGDDDDRLYARRGDDRAFGGDGADDILTGKGDDVSHGGRGRDQLFDDEGRDRLHGGRGNDRFSAHDGDRDLIRCGPGEDIALLDRRDRASGCEHAYRRASDAPRQLPEI